jgi:hypothetical protein
MRRVLRIGADLIRENPSQSSNIRGPFEPPDKEERYDKGEILKPARVYDLSCPARLPPTLTLMIIAGILLAFALCPRSSVDRALASGARSRRFDSCRGYC